MKVKGMIFIACLSTLITACCNIRPNDECYYQGSCQQSCTTRTITTTCQSYSCDNYNDCDDDGCCQSEYYWSSNYDSRYGASFDNIGCAHFQPMTRCCY